MADIKKKIDIEIKPIKPDLNPIEKEFNSLFDNLKKQSRSIFSEEELNKSHKASVEKFKEMVSANIEEIKKLEKVQEKFYKQRIEFEKAHPFKILESDKLKNVLENFDQYKSGINLKSIINLIAGSKSKAAEAEAVQFEREAYKEVEEGKVTEDTAMSMIGEAREGAKISAGKANLYASIATAYIEAFEKTAKTIKKVLNDINATFKTVLHVSLNIKDNFTDVLNYIGTMTSTTGVASYSVGTSLFTNEEARNIQLKYGVTGAQAWALSQTRSTLNLGTSDENLLYMNSSQRQLFIKLMNQYSNWYDKLESSGVLENIQSLQLEFTLFKQELAVELLSWFAENKDVLLEAVKFVAEVLKTIANVIIGIANLLGHKTINNNITFTQTNSATGVITSQTGMEDFYRQQMQMVAKQIAVSIS